MPSDAYHVQSDRPVGDLPTGRALLTYQILARPNNLGQVDEPACGLHVLQETLILGRVDSHIRAEI